MEKETTNLETDTIQEFQLVRMADQLDLVNPATESISSTVSLLRGVSSDNETRTFIIKKGRNSSPLINNASERETQFYKLLSEHVGVDVPKYIGEIEGYQVFDYINGTKDDLTLVQIINIIQIIQDTNIDTMMESTFTGEYSEPQTVTSFAASILNQLTIINPSAEYTQATHRLITLIPVLIERLNQQPQKLTHGDLWRDNIITGSNGIVVLDWENVQINNDHYDMATYYYTDYLMRDDQSAPSFAKESAHLPGFNQTCLEYNFMLQTLTQLFPAIIQTKGTNLHAWQTAWLEHYIHLVNKHFGSK